MSAPGLHVFDTTIQKTNTWIKDVMQWGVGGGRLGTGHTRQFLDRIERERQRDGHLDPDWVARSVFRVLATRVSDGEIEDVKHLLPAKLQDLWPDN